MRRFYVNLQNSESKKKYFILIWQSNYKQINIQDFLIL